MSKQNSKTVIPELQNDYIINEDGNIKIIENMNFQNDQEQINKLSSLNEDLKKIIESLENEFKKEKQKNKELSSQINNLKKLLNDILNEKERIVNEERKKVTELKERMEILNDLSNNNKKSNEDLNKLMKKLSDKDKEIEELKKLFPIKLQKGERLMNVKFISQDQYINYSIICKNTDIFTKIECLLYNEYSEYKNSKNYFLYGGGLIDKNKNLEENHIKNDSVITLVTEK